MKVSILTGTYGDISWETLALDRAHQSTAGLGAHGHYLKHQFEGTIASVRNELAEDATGDWLCFLDADDELAPGYLDAMRRAYEQESRTDGGPLLLTPAVQQVRKGRPGKPFFFPECSLETGNWLIIGTLVQRDLFMEVGGFHDHPHGLEDWNLWARCVRAGARIVKVPDAVYVAHYQRGSKHHQLQRNRTEYMKAYELARTDAWG